RVQCVARVDVELAGNRQSFANLVTLAKRRRKRSERNSTSALSTMRCSSSARYRCPLSRRGSTASSPKAAKTLTRIWTEQAPVAGVADAGFPLATVRGDRFASQRLLCRRSWSVRRRATQVCGRGLRLYGSRGRVAAHSIDEPLRWRAASASFPHRGFSI